MSYEKYPLSNPRVKQAIKRLTPHEQKMATNCQNMREALLGPILGDCNFVADPINMMGAGGLQKR